MEFKLNPLPKSEIEIKVTLPFSEFEPHAKKAAILLSEENEIEGFRRGKAPYKVVRQKFGEAAIYERGAQIAVRKTYPEVLQKISEEKSKTQEDFLPIGRPEITVLKVAPGNELQYKVKIALLPKVILPDYQKISREVRKEKKEVTVEEGEVQKTLDWIRESRATGEGEARKVPELTDDFAKSLGEFPTVDALRANVREGLQSEKEGQERERIRIRIIEEIAKSSKVEVPDVLVDSELQKMLVELKSGVEGMGMKWENYLEHVDPVRSQTPEASADPIKSDRTSNGVKGAEEALKTGWREQAERRVRVALCLREIAKLEKIEPSQEEIEERSNQSLTQFRSAEEAAVDPEELREYTKGVLRNEKVFEFLENL